MVLFPAKQIYTIPILTPQRPFPPSLVFKRGCAPGEPVRWRTFSSAPGDAHAVLRRRGAGMVAVCRRLRLCLQTFCFAFATSVLASPRVTYCAGNTSYSLAHLLYALPLPASKRMPALPRAACGILLWRAPNYATTRLLLRAHAATTANV